LLQQSKPTPNMAATHDALQEQGSAAAAQATAVDVGQRTGSELSEQEVGGLVKELEALSPTLQVGTAQPQPPSTPEVLQNESFLTIKINFADPLTFQVRHPSVLFSKALDTNICS
jgi:hypothetical protein